jgi:hypothetical protein
MRAYAHQANQRPRCRRRAASLKQFHSLRVGNAGGNLYVNGVLNNSVAQTIDPGTPASFNTAIGGLESARGQYTMNGKLDDVRLYNRALSAQEVYQLYKSGK